MSEQEFLAMFEEVRKCGPDPDSTQQQHAWMFWGLWQKIGVDKIQSAVDSALLRERKGVVKWIRELDFGTPSQNATRDLIVNSLVKQWKL